MKKLLAVLMGVIFISPVFAYDVVKLRVKISGASHKHFLCVTNAGCVSMLAGNKGKVFLMDGGKIINIVATDIGARVMKAQPVPGSCNREVKAGKTLSISGSLNPNKLSIRNLRCSVS